MSLSPQEAAWLFICNPRKLKLWQVRALEPLHLEDEELGNTYQLVQDTIQEPEDVTAELLKWAVSLAPPRWNTFVSAF